MRSPLRHPDRRACARRGSHQHSPRLAFGGTNL